jgi:hypothetical protein
MTVPDDDTLRRLLAEPERPPDGEFVMRTHRVVSVEALARLERTGAWRSCVRDLLVSTSIVGGMVVTALVAFHQGTEGLALALPLALGVATWMLVHDFRHPSFDASATTEHEPDEPRPPNDVQKESP